MKNNEYEKLSNFIQNIVENAGKMALSEVNKKHSLTPSYIKENILKPLVIKYLKETEMGFVNDSEEEEIEECTDSAGVGDFAYDAPAFAADKETANHKNLIKRSIPKTSLGEERTLKGEIGMLVENILRDIASLNEGIETALTRAWKWLDFNDPTTVENLVHTLQDAKTGRSNNDPYQIRAVQNGIIKMGKDDPSLIQNPSYKELVSLIDPNLVANFYQNKSKNVFQTMMQDFIDNPQKWNNRQDNLLLKDKFRKTQVPGVLGKAWNLFFASLGLLPPITKVRDEEYQNQAFAQKIPGNITTDDVLPFVDQAQEGKVAKETLAKAKETVTGVTKDNKQLIGKIMKRLYTYLTKYYKDNFDLDFNKHYTVGNRTDDKISLKDKFSYLQHDMLDDTKTMDAIMVYNEILNQPEDRTFLDALNDKLQGLAGTSEDELKMEGEELKYKIKKYEEERKGKSPDEGYGIASTRGIGGGTRGGDY